MCDPFAQHVNIVRIHRGRTGKGDSPQELAMCRAGWSSNPTLLRSCPLPKKWHGKCAPKARRAAGGE